MIRQKAKPAMTKAKPAKGKAKLLEFDAFVKAIPVKARIGLFFDTDPDGIASAIIAAKALRKMRGRVPEVIVPVHHSDFGEFGRIASEFRFDVAVIMDLPLDSIPKTAKVLERRARILNLDHHKFHSEISSERTLLIKPQMISKIEPSRYPTAKMCFDLFSRLADVSELDWIAATGIIGDHAWEKWEGFIRKTAKRWKMKRKDLFRAKGIADAFLSMKEDRAKELLGFLLKAKGPREFLKSRFAIHVEEFEKELEIELAIAKKEAERNKGANLIFYCFRPKFNLKNALISELSLENPEKNVVIVEDCGKSTLRASARRQDFKLSMAELMENAVKGIKGGRGGGHVPAAGASIPRKSLGRFKAELIRILSEEEARK